MAKQDIFISYASEDARAVALPLAKALRTAGLSVWLDQDEVTLGDRLRLKISNGLADSSFVLVILSRASVDKKWPLDELNAAMALEKPGHKVVLPVRYNITQQELVEA